MCLSTYSVVGSGATVRQRRTLLFEGNRQEWRVRCRKEYTQQDVGSGAERQSRPRGERRALSDTMAYASLIKHSVAASGFRRRVALAL